LTPSDKVSISGTMMDANSQEFVLQYNDNFDSTQHSACLVPSISIIYSCSSMEITIVLVQYQLSNYTSYHCKQILHLHKSTVHSF